MPLSSGFGALHGPSTLHAAEQYSTPLHPPQRCNPSVLHPPLAHLATSRATPSSPALPGIAACSYREMGEMGTAQPTNTSTTH
jgi:hypothetical protein